MVWRGFLFFKFFQVLSSSFGIGTTCPLIAPEKPKLREVVLKHFIDRMGILFEQERTSTTLIPALDQHGNQITRTVWVAE